MTSTALQALPSNQLPSQAEWGTILSMGEQLVRSGLLPATVKTPAAAAAIILKGRELGIPPMQSFAHITVIQGKPTCSAELHLALMARGGVTWEWLKDGTEGVAEIALHRPGFAKPILGRFTVEEAKKAGLLSNPSWTKYQPAMLRARAVTVAARMGAPDLTGGMSYTPEELGAQVDEDGQVVAVQPTQVTDASPASPQPSGPTDVEFTEVPAEDAQEGPQEPAEEPIAGGLDFPPSQRDIDRRNVLIAEIIAGEKAAKLSKPHQDAARKKYAGSTDLTQSSLVNLSAYLDRLNQYAAEPAKTEPAPAA